MKAALKPYFNGKSKTLYKVASFRGGSTHPPRFRLPGLGRTMNRNSACVRNLGCQSYRVIRNGPFFDISRDPTAKTRKSSFTSTSRQYQASKQIWSSPERCSFSSTSRSISQSHARVPSAQSPAWCKRMNAPRLGRVRCSSNPANRTICERQALHNFENRRDLTWC